MLKKIAHESLQPKEFAFHKKNLEKAKSIKLSSDGVMSDIHADSAYRANLVDVMTIRAVENLI